MRDILYKYNTSGMYITEDNTAFAEDSHLKLIVEPHEFSIKIGKKVLRSSSFAGRTAVVSCEGEVVFYDTDNNVIVSTDKTAKTYREVKLNWKQDSVSIQLGHTAVVDYYPNCDGEHDRWGKEWVAEYEVILYTATNQIETI